MHSKIIQDSEKGMRLDRWIRHLFPDIKQGEIQKLLRLKKITCNGKKAMANQRLEIADLVEYPDSFYEKKENIKKITLKEESLLKNLIIYQDDKMFILNKPSGLAVQGGSQINQHIDGLLDGLRFDYSERPKLVHRLDKDTSGVLVIARTSQEARYLMEAFKNHQIKKTYWALVKGQPKQKKGIIKIPLLKKKNQFGKEHMQFDEEGKEATTEYKVLETNGNFSWLELSPLSGRMHQLRVHCVSLGTPIVGDLKYGQKCLEINDKKMYLHAQKIEINLPLKKKLVIQAKIPNYMAEAFNQLGFSIAE